MSFASDPWFQINTMAYEIPSFAMPNRWFRMMSRTAPMRGRGESALQAQLLQEQTGQARNVVVTSDSFQS